MSLQKRLQQAQSLLEKKLIVVSELTQRLLEEGLKPIVVGGSAVEIYSVGDYQSADIDIVLNARDRAVRHLQQMGFLQEGRMFYHPEWRIAIEIPSETLAGSLERITELKIDEGVVYCIGLEDLLIDRLNASVHWKSQEDRRWAQVLIQAYSHDIDWDYLRQRACEESTLQELEQILQEIRDAEVGLDDTSSACG